MLIMFNIPKQSRSEKIPNGFIPEKKLQYVLTELGLNYLADQKM